MLRQQNDATEKQVVYRPCPGAHGLRKRKVAASPAVSGPTVASSYEKKWRENLSSIHLQFGLAPGFSKDARHDTSRIVGYLQKSGTQGRVIGSSRKIPETHALH